MTRLRLTVPVRASAGLALLTLLGVAAAAMLAPADRGTPPGPPLKKAPPTEYECRWTDGPIKIDGKGDDQAWQAAQVIDQFYLPWLGKDARLARTATKAKLLWDREYLYFFADMEDTDLYADVREHDGMTWDNDVFELFFKPDADKPGYYEFQVNAAGTVMDLFLPRRGAGGYKRFVKDGDFHIEAKVHLRGTLNKWTDKDQGWSVEGRIPWRDFLRTGGRPEPDEKWKFALCRYDYSVDFEGPELSTCAPLKSKSNPDFHHHEDYATLRFVPQPRQSDVRPYGVAERVPLTTSKVVGSPDPPPPFRVERAFPKLQPDFPIGLHREPGSDRLLLITQPRSYGPTRIIRFKDEPDAEVEKAETLLEHDGTAYSIAFHPQFEKNGYLYVGLNSPHSGTKADKKTRVLRYTMSRQPPYRLDPKSAVTIIEWPSDGHNGGAVTFGHDGMLYVTSGDGTSDSDTNVAGQKMDSLLSKVLRIDVDHPDPGKEYSVPKDNPFVGRRGIAPETWAYGLRNPWRITTDEKTGHIWVGNNGQDLWEQAYLVRKGDNYGWSVYEGSYPFYLSRKLGPTPHVKPTIEHPHSEFRSLTGGIVYYGRKHPELHGAYLYGDYSTGKIWGMKHDGTRVLWHRELATTTLHITGFGTDSQGEVLICDHRGRGEAGLYRLVPTPKDLPPSTFPRKLSESGLFRSVKGHVMVDALIPYSVNAPLWSDGAYKARWLGLPGANTHIDFPGHRGWNFPDRTVLVKSFALEREEGKPESRRWIETRFLTKQDGEWAGYSYLWNDEQTDAVLVEAKGADREYTIRVPRSPQHPDGVRVQKWHYPSRTECMVCHSRAANFVLGLTELQMNRVHDYGNGVRDNQLRTLEHLGLLRVDYLGETKERMRQELRERGKSEKEAREIVDRQTASRLQRTPAGRSRLLSYDPEKYPKLADPYDQKADLAARARSYLHANCAQCHVEAGGGNAQMELEFTTALEKMRVLDVPPVHHTFGLPDARLIAPGHPERSVLLHRISHREQGHMPPLGTALVDREAVELLRAWVKQLKAETPKEYHPGSR